MGNWLVQHLAVLVSVPAAMAAAAAWVSKNGVPFVAQKVAALDAQLLAGITSPTGKKIAVGVQKVLNDAIPGAGAAQYAQATDELLAHVPEPEKSLARAPLLAALTALGAGAKAGLAEAAQAPEPPQA